MNTKHREFILDMKPLGHNIEEEYTGRYDYRGPAVVCGEEYLQDVIRATEIPLQWDSMGKHDLVVYPA